MDCQEVGTQPGNSGGYVNFRLLDVDSVPIRAEQNIRDISHSVIGQHTEELR